MKSSKRAIKEIFKDKDFVDIMDRYFKGEFDPYKAENWIIDEWEFTFMRFPMNKFGARQMLDVAESEDEFAVSLTYKDDSDFTAISVKKKYGGLLLWLLDTIGFENYQEIEKFNPNDYNVYNELKTMEEGKK